MTVLKVKYALWASDHLRAIKFYQDTFGAELQFEMEVWSELTLCGSTIGIHGGGEGKRTWTGLTFQVADVVVGATEIVAAGGKCEREPQPEDGEAPHLAMCEDSDGNQIMLSRAR